MTVEEVLTLVPTLAPSDHKRMLEGLEPEAPERPDESNAELDEDKTAQDELSSDDNRDMLGSENGFQTDKQGEQVKDNDLNEVKFGNEQGEDVEPSLEEVDVTLETKEINLNLETEEVEVNTVKAEEQSAEDHDTIALQEASPENDSKTESASNTENASNTESAPSNKNASNPETKVLPGPIIEETKEVNDDVPQEISDTETDSHKLDVPSSKLIPQHLPEGDVSKERIVRVTGDRKQIEIARELINDVMNQAGIQNINSTHQLLVRNMNLATCPKSFRIGKRVHSTNDTRRIGTVKYIGPVENYSGIWVGVDWDKDGEGKHDGSIQGVQYFLARSERSGSFVRIQNLSFGISLLQALKLRYKTDSTKEEEDEMYVLSTSNNHVSIQLLGKDKIQDKLSRFEELTGVSLSYLGVSSLEGPCDISTILAN